MPTYEYKCESCGKTHEEVQRMTDEPLTTCPYCHEETLKRQVSVGNGFVLKGGGWYKDGYSTPKSDT